VLSSLIIARCASLKLARSNNETPFAPEFLEIRIAFLSFSGEREGR